MDRRLSDHLLSDSVTLKAMKRRHVFICVTEKGQGKEAAASASGSVGGDGGSGAGKRHETSASQSVSHKSRGTAAAEGGR